MKKLESLYQYKVNEEIINNTVRLILENGNDYKDEKMKERMRKFYKELIEDFVDKFDIYYTDNYEDFVDKKVKKQAMKDYNRMNYEITLVNKNDKRKKFRTYIELPMIIMDNRYTIDLGYIFTALGFSAATDDDIGGLENERDARAKDEESNRLWDYLDVLDDKDSFWIDILRG